MNYPIAIIAANRFNYFQQTFDALAPQIKDRQLFLFLDKPLNGGVDLQHVEYVKEKKIKNFTAIVRDTHYGCGRNIIDARRHIFENTSCDAMHLFEDDMVPAPHYIEMNEKLFKKQTSLHFNVGATQLWKMCFLTREEKEQRKDEVRATFDSLLGYIISRRCWDDVGPFLYAYEQMFLRGENYRLRPHNDIWKWIISQHIFQPRFRFTPSYIYNKDDEVERIGYMQRFITGQDGVTIHMMHILGWVRLSPIVNYGKYVGEWGVHHHPDLFRKQGYDKIEMFGD